MAAHNRRLAGVWHLGDPGGSAAPLTKWQVPKDSAELFCAVIERDWKDGELPVRHPVTGKVKATFRGFSIYGNTRQPHDAAKQAASTIVFEGGANFTIFRNGVPGFAPIESALLKHAEKWCVRWPHLLHGPGSVLSASCHTATPLFVRVKQPYFAWAVLVRQGPDFEGATDLDWHQDWRPPSDKDPKATRSVLTYAVKLNNGASSVELPDGRYAYNKAAGSVVCFHSKAYHRVLAGMTATKTLKLLLHVCDGSLFGDPYAYPELPVLSTEGKAPSALPVDRRGNKTSRSSIDGRLQWGEGLSPSRAGHGGGGDGGDGVGHGGGGDGGGDGPSPPPPNITYQASPARAAAGRVSTAKSMQGRPESPHECRPNPSRATIDTPRPWSVWEPSKGTAQRLTQRRPQRR